MSESRYFSKKTKNIASIFIIIVGGGFGLYNMLVENVDTGCVITDKVHLGNTAKGNHIYAEGCNGSDEVKEFYVRNNWFAGKFNSANETYSQIEVGKTYDFETRGINVPYLLLKENIVKVTLK